MAGRAMSFRRKLLLVFALTVILSVAAVAWFVSTATRRAFEQSNEELTSALVAQFRHEFDRRGEDVARRVEAIAESDSTTRMALALSHGSPDYGAFLNSARTIADSQQLDFLEFITADGTIISSAQWPAKFGYKEDSLPALVPKEPFLKQEELPDGAVLGLFAEREVDVGDTPLRVVGGSRLDKEFLASLELPAGMRAMFYANLTPAFSSGNLFGSGENLAHPEKLKGLIQEVQQRHQATSALLHWSSDAADDETVHAIPLTGQGDQVLGILLVGSSRRTYVQLRQRIQSAALLVGGSGHCACDSVQQLGGGASNASGGTAR